jgi:VWFA-related protein
MKAFAKDVLRPGDQAMIATWNRSMKIRVPFTDDAVMIQQTLDSLAGESALGVQNTSDRRMYEQQIRDSRSYNAALSHAKQYAQQVEHDLRQSVQAINGLMTTLAGVEGKKILVLTSEGFPMQPGREMFEYLDAIQREKSDWGTSASSSVLEGMSFDGRGQLNAIARAANANAITLYSLHAGGLGAMIEGGAENATPIPHSVQQAAVTNSTDSLQYLADLTGGRAAVGTNNFKNAFAQIIKDLDSYYSIGYKSSTQRVDRSRNVEVRARNRAYQVRSRKSFVEKSMGTEMTDRVVANLFYPTKTNDLNILVVTGKPIQVDADRFKVPVEVRIPMTKLTFLPQGEVYMGSFTIYVGVANRLGDMSDISQKNHRMTLTKEDVGKIEGKHFNYSLELLMEKGRNKISIGVNDDIANVQGFDIREVLAANLD